MPSTSPVRAIPRPLRRLAGRADVAEREHAVGRSRPGRRHDDDDADDAQDRRDRRGAGASRSGRRGWPGCPAGGAAMATIRTPTSATATPTRASQNAAISSQPPPVCRDRSAPSAKSSEVRAAMTSRRGDEGDGGRQHDPRAGAATAGARPTRGERRRQRRRSRSPPPRGPRRRVNVAPSGLRDGAVDACRSSGDRAIRSGRDRTEGEAGADGGDRAAEAVVGHRGRA